MISPLFTAPTRIIPHDVARHVQHEVHHSHRVVEHGRVHRHDVADHDRLLKWTVTNSSATSLHLKIPPLHVHGGELFVAHEGTVVNERIQSHDVLRAARRHSQTALVAQELRVRKEKFLNRMKSFAITIHPRVLQVQVDGGRARAEIRPDAMAVVGDEAAVQGDRWRIVATGRVVNRAAIVMRETAVADRDGGEAG